MKPQDVIKTAAGEIGYIRWNDSRPGTKYGRAYASRHGVDYSKNGVPYCAMFVTWTFHQLGTTPPGGDFAYCPYGIRAMKRLGLEVQKTRAQPGDLVFFDWGKDGESDHVGIVEANNGKHLTTIEGNTTFRGYSGAVARRTRNFQDVCNVFRPRYDAPILALAPGKTSLVVDGYFGPASIRRLQHVLGTPVDGVISQQPATNKHYLPNATGGWEWVTQGATGSTVVRAWQRKTDANPDGLFGLKTVQRAQAFLGVPVDGYAGPETMKAWQTYLNNQ